MIAATLGGNTFLHVRAARDSDFTRAIPYVYHRFQTAGEPDNSLDLRCWKLCEQRKRPYIR